MTEEHFDSTFNTNVRGTLFTVQKALPLFNDNGSIILNGSIIPKSTLSQHFRTLREAGLIRSERKGVEMFNTSRCEEVDRHYPGLISTIVKAHEIQTRRENRAQRKR